MSDATQISETEAIRQVIADTEAADFIDIVNQVKKRFRLNVSSAQVEQVFHILATKKKEVAPVSRDSRINLEMTSKLPEVKVSAEPVQTKSTGEAQPPVEQPSDELGHALHFVKSVHGLANAKRLLAELETIMRGSA